MAAVQHAHIQWQWAQPGEGADSADTHCCICLNDEITSPILAHQITDAGEIGHRVHRACLLEAENEECPSCLRSYDPSELPVRTSELPVRTSELPVRTSELPVRTIDIITDMLSEGKELGIRIAINFSTYAAGGIFFSVCLLVTPILEGLTEKGSSSLLGLVTGSLLGACMAATALSLVGDISLYAGRRIIEWINVQNPTLRKVLFVFTAAIAAIASIYAAILLYSFIETYTVAQLAPQAQDVYSYLIHHADGYSGVSLAMWNAAVLAHDRMFGVSFGSIAAFCSAFAVKQGLFQSEANLDETIASIE